MAAPTVHFVMGTNTHPLQHCGNRYTGERAGKGLFVDVRMQQNAPPFHIQDFVDVRIVVPSGVGMPYGDFEAPRIPTVRLRCCRDDIGLPIDAALMSAKGATRRYSFFMTSIPVCMIANIGLIVALRSVRGKSRIRQSWPAVPHG